MSDIDKKKLHWLAKLAAIGVGAIVGALGGGFFSVLMLMAIWGLYDSASVAIIQGPPIGFFVGGGMVLWLLGKQKTVWVAIVKSILVASLISCLFVAGFNIQYLGTPYFISNFTPNHWKFESVAELENIRTQLPLAEANWKSHNITDYDIDVQVLMLSCQTNLEGKPTTLSVRKGKLVINDEIRKQKLEEEIGCHISEKLPPMVFDSIRQILEEAKPDKYYLTIEFDPTYGFVSRYDLTTNNKKIPGLYAHYIFSNFRPITP